jgi:homopolymeric O-antigen transport system permease protein
VSQIPSHYELLIRPTRGWLHVDLPEVWRYRDLLFMLVRRDFIAKYKQTILGPAWFIVQPLLMTMVFTVIFGNVVGIPTDGLPPVLFYLAGLVAWNYFAQTFQHTGSTLVANAGLFGKVYFPRLVVPLSAVISNLVAFALQLATFLAFWLWFKLATPAGETIHITGAVGWLIPLLAQVAALSLGIGLWLSALTAKYRDFTFLTGFIIQVWMYATPVIYPLSQIPGQWRWLAVVNPMTMPVEATRLMFLGQGVVNPAYVALSVAMTLVLLVSGVIVFNKVEKTFVDTV